MSDRAEEICLVCGGVGRTAQGPWPLPFSMPFCDLCYELEGIAYDLWRSKNWQSAAAKFSCPIPLLDNFGCWPEDIKSWSLDKVKEYLLEKVPSLPRDK
jgi:hypothetical protein